MAAWMLPAAIMASSVLSAFGQNKAARESAESKQSETVNNAPWGPLQPYLIGQGALPGYLSGAPQVSDEWMKWNALMAGGGGTGPAPSMLAKDQEGWQGSEKTKPKEKKEEGKKAEGSGGLDPATAQAIIAMMAPGAGQTWGNQVVGDGGWSGGNPGALYRSNPTIPQGLAQSAGYPSPAFANFFNR